MFYTLIISIFLTYSLSSTELIFHFERFHISNIKNNVGLINTRYYHFLRSNEVKSLLLLVNKVNDNNYNIDKRALEMVLEQSTGRKFILGTKDIDEIKLSLAHLGIEVIAHLGDKKYKFFIKIPDCLVLFKLVTEQDTKYLLALPPFHYQDRDTKDHKNNDKNGIFCGEDIKFKEICIDNVFGNIDMWKNLNYMFCRSKVEEISFNPNIQYKFKSSNFSFSHCKNLKKINGLKSLFNNNLKKAEFMFLETESLDNIDISHCKLPEECLMMFAHSGVKHINMTGTDFINVKHSIGLFYGSDIENLDFSEVKNFNPKEMTMMVGFCENLKNLNLDGLNLENTKCIVANFNGTKNLKKLDLSKIKLNQEVELFNELIDFDKEIILPNDSKSALAYLKSFDFRTTKDVGDLVIKKITYHGTELSNFSKYDSPEGFIYNTKGYLKNRDEVIERNKKEFNGPRCCECFEKCCKSCKS